MASLLHLKLLGFKEKAGRLVLPPGGFFAVFNEYVDKMLYEPLIPTLELHDTKNDVYLNVYKIFGGMPDDKVSPHVTLTSKIVIVPVNIEIMNPIKPAILTRLVVFPVHEWKN